METFDDLLGPQASGGSAGPSETFDDLLGPSAGAQPVAALSQSTSPFDNLLEPPPENEYKKALVDRSILGIPVRFAKAFPGAVVNAVEGLPPMFERAGEGVSALIQGPEHAVARAEEALQQLQAPPTSPVTYSPPTPQGFRYKFAPTEAGPKVTDLVDAEPPPAPSLEEQLAKARTSLQVAQEARDTMGASVVRDVARAGLVASTPVNPVGLALGVGLPATMEAAGKATGLEGVTEELAQRAGTLSNSSLAAAGLGKTAAHGPLGEGVADLVRALPELVLLETARRGAVAERTGKPAFGPEPVKPGIPGAEKVAQELEATAINKSIERARAKEAGQVRPGTGPKTAPPPSPAQDPTFIAAVKAYAKDPFGPGGDALKNYNLYAGVEKGFAKAAELVLPARTFQNLKNYLTPVMDNLPPEVREILQSGDRTGTLGLNQASALVTDIAKTLPESQQLLMRNLLDNLPRKPLPRNQWVEGEAPTTLGGAKRPLPPTPENLRNRSAYYLNEASALVDSVLPGNKNPALKELVKQAVTMQRLSEDVAGLDLTKTFNATLSKAKLAELRNLEVASLKALPEEFRGTISRQIPPEPVINRTFEELGQTAEKMAAPALSTLETRLAGVKEEIAQGRRPNQSLKQQRVAEAEARLQELTPKPAEVPRPRIFEGPAASELSGKPRPEIRKALKPAVPEVQPAPPDVVAQFKKKAPKGDLIPEAGQVYPTGKSRPTLVKPIPPSPQGKLVDAVGNEIGKASTELRNQQKSLDTVLHKEGVQPTDSSILKVGPQVTQKVNSQVRGVDTEAQAAKVNKALVDQFGQDLKTRMEIDRLTDVIKKNKLPSPEAMDLLQKASKQLEKQIETMPEKVQDYIAVVQEEQRAFLQGGKGHLPKRYAEDLAKAAEDMLSEIDNQAGPPTPTRLQAQNRERTDYLTRRNPKVDKERIKSATLPLYDQITNNFNLGKAKQVLGGILNTPFAKDARTNETLRTALEKQGWKTVPDSDMYGPLAGHTVDPRIANALEINNGIHADPQGNMAHMNTWLAGNAAAKNPAALAANTAGSVWTAWTELGIPPWKAPHVIFKLGAEAPNDPKWGPEIQSLGMSTLARPRLEKFAGKAFDALRKRGMGDWLLDDAKRKNFLEYQEEFKKYSEAVLAKKGASKVVMKDVTDVIDLMGVMARKVMTPAVGEGMASLLDPLKLGEVYGDFEQMLRWGSYVHLRKNGWTVEAARDKVNKAYVDYDNISPMVKDLRLFKGGLGNRFLQFVAKQTDNGLRSATTLNLTTLARFWAPALAFGALTALARKQSGETKQETQKRLNLSKNYQGYPNRLFMVEIWDPEAKRMNTLDFGRANPYGLAMNLMTDILGRSQGKKGINVAGTLLQPAMATYPILEEIYNHQLYYDQAVRPDQAGGLERPWNLALTLEHLMSGYLPSQYGRTPATLARQLRGKLLGLNINNLRGIPLKDSDLLVNFLTGVKLTENDPQKAIMDWGQNLKGLVGNTDKLRRNPNIAVDQFPVLHRFLAEDIQQQARLVRGEK